MKPYLFIWNPSQTEVLQQHIVDFLNTRPEIRNWYVPFLGTILLVADSVQNPSTLSNLIHGRFPTLLLTVTPVDMQTANGWMPQVFWDLIREPKSSGRWPDTPPQTDYLTAIRTLADLYGKKEPPSSTPKSLADIIAGLSKNK